MSIQTTVRLGRQAAIERIRAVVELVTEKNYIGLQRVTYEDGEGLQRFVDAGIDFEPANIEKWTNVMLEDKLDEPFFRRSMFDNYIVVDDEQ
jgi:hypothetical protein